MEPGGGVGEQSGFTCVRCTGRKQPVESHLPLASAASAAVRSRPAAAGPRGPPGRAAGAPPPSRRLIILIHHSRKPPSFAIHSWPKLLPFSFKNN